MVDLSMIKSAAAVIRPVVKKTPLDYASYLSERWGRTIFLKLENRQKTGSFKIRGAYYKLKCLMEQEAVKSVVAASAGNHGQGVALAANLLNLPSTIVMPQNAAITKINAVKAFGGQVILKGSTMDDCFAEAFTLHIEHDQHLIHAFDDADIIAGQGTVGLELIDELDSIACVVVPVGGGGLIAGIAAAVKELIPTVKVIGVQAAGAASMVNAVNSGRIEKLPIVSTIADGIAIQQPGELTYALVRKYVDELVTVSDEEIASAILFALEQSKLVVEGAGAVTLAALLHNHLDLPQGNSVLILSGGNIDINQLARIIERGLVKSHRRMRLRTVIPDLPGALTELIQIIAQSQANIVEIYHNRLALDVLLKDTEVVLNVEIRDQAHASQVLAALKRAGYQPVLI